MSQLHSSPLHLSTFLRPTTGVLTNISLHSSQQHRDYLSTRKRALGRASIISDSEHFGVDDASLTESSSNWGLISVDPAIPKDVLKEDGSALEVKGTSPSFSAFVFISVIFNDRYLAA